MARSGKELFMTRSATPTLDHAEEVAHLWINELGDYLHWSDDARTQRLLRAVLHTIRDFLTIDEAADLAAQLPVLIRGLYYEGWDPSSAPERPRNKKAFMDHVNDAFFEPQSLENPEEAVACVIKLLYRHVSGGQMAQVRQSLRKDLRFLFPDA
jgi:uncharacterized protein (DUF2267 family)